MPTSTPAKLTNYQRTTAMPMQPQQSPPTAQPRIQTTSQGRPRVPPAQAQPRQMPQMPPPTPAPPPPKPTPTPVPPPDVKAYLDRQLKSDQKFHMTVNGGDLALTPFHVWPQKTTGPNSTSTSVSMRSDEGRVYDIEFVTTGAQVSSIRINRINGEAVR
jgi:hypothetical protein